MSDKPRRETVGSEINASPLAGCGDGAGSNGLSIGPFTQLASLELAESLCNATFMIISDQVAIGPFAPSLRREKCNSISQPPPQRDTKFPLTFPSPPHRGSMQRRSSQCGREPALHLQPGALFPLSFSGPPPHPFAQSCPDAAWPGCGAWACSWGRSYCLLNFPSEYHGTTCSAASNRRRPGPPNKTE